MTSKRLHFKRLLFSMASLVDLGQEATSSKDLSEKMRAALYIITGIFSVPTAALFVYHPQRRLLELVTSKGRDKTLPAARLSGLSLSHIQEPFLYTKLSCHL